MKPGDDDGRAGTFFLPRIELGVMAKFWRWGIDWEIVRLEKNRSG